MALTPKGVRTAIEVARDITIAALSENSSLSFVQNGEVVAEFYETIYRKIEELIINETTPE